MKTAAEFFDEGNFNNVTDMLIEFAKMHVQEALKQASEKGFIEYIDLTTDETFDYTDLQTAQNLKNLIAEGN